MVQFTKKKEYDAPMVEQLQARVEKGFAGSGNSGISGSGGGSSPQGLQGSGTEDYGKGIGNETGGYVFN